MSEPGGQFASLFQVNLGKGVDGQDALHKPLLLLLFLKASSSPSSRRLVPFEMIDSVMGPMLEKFGESSAVEYPFVRLGNDRPKIWEVPGIERAMPRKGQTDAKRSELLRLGLAGGFTKNVWTTLRGDQAARKGAIAVVAGQIRNGVREQLLMSVLGADALE